TRGSPAGPSGTIRAPTPPTAAARALASIATTSSPGRNHPSTARQVRPAPTTHRGHAPLRPGPSAPGSRTTWAGQDRSAGPDRPGRRGHWTGPRTRADPRRGRGDVGRGRPEPPGFGTVR